MFPLCLAFGRVPVVLYAIVPTGILIPGLVLATEEKTARQEDQGDGLGFSHLYVFVMGKDMNKSLQQGFAGEDPAAPKGRNCFFIQPGKI